MVMQKSPIRRHWRYRAGMIFSIILFLFDPSQTIAEDNRLRERVNQGTFGLLASSFATTDLHLAADLALAFNTDDDLRILPIVGQGSIKAIEDLLYLKGVDIAIVQSDVLDMYKELGGVVSVEDRIHYIAKLNEDEVHVLARSEYRGIEELHGKSVSFGTEDSGSFLTASLIFEDLGIDVEVQAIQPSLALQRMIEGRLDAMVVVDGAPILLLRAFDPEGRFHLLPLPVTGIRGSYVASELTNDDYPNLITYGSLETVATSALLAAYDFRDNGPRRAKVNKFVDRLFR